MRMIFFDTETTGIRPGSICQLSYIIVDRENGRNSVQAKNMFFTVEYIEPSAAEVNGFSEEMLYELSEGKYFEDRMEEIHEDFNNADFLIGHNVKFDINFLTHELEGCGEELNIKQIFCTMMYYKNICKIVNGRGEIKNPKLEEVVKFLAIDEKHIIDSSNKFFGESGNYHDARFDTAATYLIVTEGIKKGYIPKNFFTNKSMKSN
ncbi:3'-5' exonuclease [Clostridium oryzae]|uniref:DNA polymerase III subunit epsilon n=1 Tax=Clostridium oryzae TaxID=1450648 RepID=A0A1V4IKF2_9CLOT|nr:3'-5' exonuclease [Clostridium oryzae]OPJ60383.1 DNA polymerase III subunit epsilon [Clostridium oryzae]